MFNYQQTNLLIFFFYLCSIKLASEKWKTHKRDLMMRGWTPATLSHCEQCLILDNWASTPKSVTSFLFDGTDVYLNSMHILTGEHIVSAACLAWLHFTILLFKGGPNDTSDKNITIEKNTSHSQGNHLHTGRKDPFSKILWPSVLEADRFMLVLCI